MKTWQELALQYHKEGMKTADIARRIEKELDMMFLYDRVQKYIKRHADKDSLQNEKRIAIQNQEPNITESFWDGSTHIRFGLMGDTQIGSKYTQLTYLHNFYNLVAEMGITDVYHTGDITDGLKMRVGHE